MRGEEESKTRGERRDLENGDSKEEGIIRRSGGERGEDRGAVNRITRRLVTMLKVCVVLISSSVAV